MGKWAELTAEVERLTAVEAEHTELSKLFAMQFDADVRAVKEWRDKNPGNDLVWPDSSRLAVWALEQRDAGAAEAANSAAQRDEAVLRATQAEERLRAVEADLAAVREWAAEWTKILADANEAAAVNYRAAQAAEAELARIRAADRTSITVRTTEAAKMRKGQAI
jgi:hypothetical protein